MKLLFEKSNGGAGCAILPPCDVPAAAPPDALTRKAPLPLPGLPETELSRHYTQLSHRAFGVNSGFYPLGSCTMKYSPKINEQAASLFSEVHPLQPCGTAQGCLEALSLAQQYLCEITGMDRMSFAPAAGAHGEFTGLLMIKAYHQSRGDHARKKMLIPDSAHGTNPASAAMAGFTAVTVPSGPDGCVDLEALRKTLGPDTAGLMLTNPNTLGLFEKNILAITRMVHEAGGLVYYDGANLNAVVGVARPGDMGFDVVHLNLHKTFSAPHGGGGPGSGPVGCKSLLAPFLPVSLPEDGNAPLSLPRQSMTEAPARRRVGMFYGNFAVVVKALTYILSLGGQGLAEVAQDAVLNANYMKKQLSDLCPASHEGFCCHEFVLSLQKIKETYGVGALDFAKAMLDHGMHPPTMYFPLIVPEALMIEPTETESKETMDRTVDLFRTLLALCRDNPQALHDAPLHTPVRRVDEVGAARHPVLRSAGT